MLARNANRATRRTNLIWKGWTTGNITSWEGASHALRPACASISSCTSISYGRRQIALSSGQIVNPRPRGPCCCHAPRPLPVLSLPCGCIGLRTPNLGHQPLNRARDQGSEDPTAAVERPQDDAADEGGTSSSSSSETAACLSWAGSGLYFFWQIGVTLDQTIQGWDAGLVHNPIMQ